MKAFTVHDVFKIALFTDAPCILGETCSGGRNIIEKLDV